MYIVGKRQWRLFPPYATDFDSYIAALLAEVGGRVRSPDPNRSWLDPYRDFEDLAQKAASHYRFVSETVVFGGTLLQKWIVDSISRCTQVHIHLIDSPLPGTEKFLQTVAESLRNFIHVSSLFFRDKTKFQHRHAKSACDDLAILGIQLIQRGYSEVATECATEIVSIAGMAAATETGSYRTYGFADCLVPLEIMARAAEMLEQHAIAAAFRAIDTRPAGIVDHDWPQYVEAVENRIRHMTRELREGGREDSNSPLAFLRHLRRARPAPKGE